MATKATIPSEAQDGQNVNPYDKIGAGLAEAVAFAKGEKPAACIHVHGHEYVPAAELDALKSERDGLRDALTHANHMQRLTQDTRNALQAENDRLRVALADLVSWFPLKTRQQVWILDGGQYGADDAISAARAALNGEGA
jgi:hypothetical protein